MESVGSGEWGIGDTPNENRRARRNVGSSAALLTGHVLEALFAREVAQHGAYEEDEEGVRELQLRGRRVVAGDAGIPTEGHRV